MGKDAGNQTFRPVGDKIIQRAGGQCRDAIGSGMSEAKRHRHDAKRQPRKLTERYREKAFVDQITKQKSAPKNFLTNGTTTTRRRKRITTVAQ